MLFRSHRVELNSTLLWHLHDLWPELRLPGGALFSNKCATRIGRRLARAEQTMRVRIARDELRRLRVAGPNDPRIRTRSRVGPFFLHRVAAPSSEPM